MPIEYFKWFMFVMDTKMESVWLRLNGGSTYNVGAAAGQLLDMLL